MRPPLERWTMAGPWRAAHRVDQTLDISIRSNISILFVIILLLYIIIKDKTIKIAIVCIMIFFAILITFMNLFQYFKYLTCGKSEKFYGQISECGPL